MVLFFLPMSSGIYGHSTVYHGETNAFYVFGGILYDVDKIIVSSKLFSFHWPTSTWAVLAPEGGIEAANKFVSQFSCVPTFDHDR
jgi:hypothetical protein